MTSVYFDWLQNCACAQDVLVVQHIPPLPLDPVWGGVYHCLLKLVPLNYLAVLYGASRELQWLASLLSVRRYYQQVTFFFSCLVCFVLFHFEAWSHSESTWPQLKGILLLQPPKCSDYCSSSDIINIVFFSYWHITHLSSVLSTVVLSRMSWALVVQLQWESLEELSVL